LKRKNVKGSIRLVVRISRVERARDVKFVLNMKTKGGGYLGAALCVDEDEQRAVPGGEGADGVGLHAGAVDVGAPLAV
jgi:hypothetical protein